MLDQVATQTTAVVFAPEELADRFDQHGCLIPAAWADVEVPLAAENVHLADDPVDQADEVARAIAAFDGQFAASEITVGVCDERIIPQIERQLAECEIAARWGPGIALPTTGPYRALAAIAAYLDRGRFADFAALVRHPDVESWINNRLKKSHWLDRLDAYQATHLQTRLTGDWLGEEERHQTVRQLFEAVEELLAKFRATPRRPLAKWNAPLRSCLKAIYGHRECDLDDHAQRAGYAALEQALTALNDHQRVPASLAPSVTATEAIAWLLESLAKQSSAAPTQDDAVELLGWLELPLDDAPALVVATFNEGFVPKSANSDLFLPNRLRKVLGLDENDRRYARDAYATSVIAASRQALRLVVGRRDADNNPLAPSRLLFACGEAALAPRVMSLLHPAKPVAEKPPLAGGLITASDNSQFDVPRPMPLPEPIDSLSATDFKSYLACPYRFYLSRLLRLESIDDAADELDPANFGTLIHNTLNEFGRDDRRHTDDAGLIHELLTEKLDILLEHSYGDHTRAAVAVQVEQLRMRLAAFAVEQAQWASRGWRIEFTERPDPEEDERRCELTVDGRPFHLRGRIDRIDRNVHDNAWAVFDYKSSEAGDAPEKTHRDRHGNWVDLQLPLYRQLASVLDVDGQIHLGYIVLPKDTQRTGFLMAEWTPDDLAAADELAHDVDSARTQRGVLASGRRSAGI